MKKKYLIAIALLSICMFAGCGSNQSNNSETRMEQEESQEENEETDIPKFTTATTEDESKEEQPKFQKVTSEETEEEIMEETVGETIIETGEKVVEGDGVLSWKMDYQALVNNWEQEQGESVIGYELIYLDEDSIPELAMYCNDEAYVGIDLYTYVDGQAKHLDKYDMQGNQTDAGAFTSEGRQGQGDEYIPEKGILFQSGSMMGTTWVYGYKLENGRLNCIIEFYQMMDSADGSMSYELNYKKKDGNIVSKGGAGNVYFETCPDLPDIEREYGFLYSSRERLPKSEKGYGEIMDRLNE